MRSATTTAPRSLAAARAGCSAALGETLEACRRYLLWVARHQLDPGLSAKAGASDLVQETFLEAHQAFERFHGTSEAELLAWLHTLLLHNVLNFARRYRDTAKRSVAGERSLDAEDNLAAVVPGSSAQPADVVLERERAELLDEAIDGLPGEYRQVMRWWHQEAISFEEIGARLGRSANTARNRWHEALKMLGRKLESLR